MRLLRSSFFSIDWALAFSALLLALLGLATMYSYLGENSFFERQAVWIVFACVGMLAASVPDYRFLRAGSAALFIYTVCVAMLVVVLFFGDVALGAQSRFNFVFFSLQPADPAKLALIIVLAKYFAKRHVEIAHLRHIFVSGLYAGALCALLFFQPDFGSALIVGGIWLGMLLVSGISLRHLALFGLLCTLSFGLLWSVGLREYQKERIVTFLDPFADTAGAGYNAYQSTIAVGSGQFFGTGVGFGTQSKLQFLPEYETDFIFAAFAEEWGTVGVAVLFALFGVVIWRVLSVALHSAGNYERFFCAGVAIFFISHFFVHVGMNIGLLPVTGTTIPFLSYGGSHLVVEFVALGMVMGIRKARAVS